MKICIPVEITQGTKNALHGHFTSAPRFLIYDTNRYVSEVIQNPYEKDQYKFHRSLKSLRDHFVDVTIVGGVNRCTLQKLNSNGVKVFKADGHTIAENIISLENGELTEMKPENLHWGHDCR